ncbi:hypothetical protein JB92DRAFT_81333 [Gautieria morchelliformis]|nr:hypothetical protein JB92DRAFT_81333 [Gautieria morchelliformis]
MCTCAGFEYLQLSPLYFVGMPLCILSASVTSTVGRPVILDSSDSRGMIVSRVGGMSFLLTLRKSLDADMLGTLIKSFKSCCRDSMQGDHLHDNKSKSIYEASSTA